MARRTGDDLRVAILGLGEAGGRLAADLVALGAEVSGWDPAPVQYAAGVRQAGDAGTAVRGTDVILSLNSAGAAVVVAQSCLDALTGSELYADLNTTSPRVKLDVAELVAERGVLFADVALMAPVPARGIATPALASGPGAEAFARVFRPFGMPVEVLSAEPGDAAKRKLLRSVFMKGLAASIVESLEAAAAAGCEDWLRANIASTLESADASLVDRLVDGSRRHAARRVEEMEAACDVLRGLGVEPRVAASAAAQLVELERRRERIEAQ